ncbi:MAG: PhzF family phenazine biosynthesis protein [Alphaproteobacteria bacterium]|nr:PhzF family phenazine biosynthesis protein [Alphaproteobacteria bacterium]
MTSSLTMYQVDAFADALFAGNPAAVLVLEEALDVPLMQAIAAENNLPETAFAVRQKDGYALRWFTPANEAAFCGHATLATVHVLVTEYGATGTLRFATNVGDLTVSAGPDGYSMILPAFAPETVDPEPDWVGALFPGGVRAVFKNFENKFVELGSQAEVEGYVPDLAALSEVYDIDLCITARGDEVDFVSRYFAPRAGIPEDPVTGSTHATLVPFWAERLGKTVLRAVQCSKRGGALGAEMQGETVRLTGSAVTFMRAQIAVR